MNTKVNFTTPVGRLVMGDLYKPQTTDADNKPLVIKNGPNAGQPTQRFFFAVAIPKNPGETHWANTSWGQKIWGVGHAAFPQGQAQSPAFAWKVIDGDSQVPNTKGKKPCEREGYPGHWVVSFSSSFPPKIYNADGSAALTEPGAVKPGYFVQVNADVDGNGSPLKPGVYINHNMVALSGYGPEIYFGPDVASAGFGGAPLPPGASATPVGGFTPPAAPAPAVGAPQYAAPPVPGPAIGVPPANPSSPPPPAAAAPAPTPNYAVLGVPPAAPVAAAPVPPPVAAPVAPVAPRRVMTAAAQGATYEQLVAVGWNDQLLITNGMMVMQ